MSRGRRVSTFTLDLNYLSSLWPAESKFLVRSGDGPPVSLDKTARKEDFDGIGGFEPCDTVRLNADRGYLLWVNPRGSVQVKFKYGRTGDDFKCFVNPEHKGVKVYEVRSFGRELIIDGKLPFEENPRYMKKSAVRPRENNFEFQSKNGELNLLLEVVQDDGFQLPPAFKLNYVLTL
ncbi:hypothetical protein HOLleu_08552 [Holothuria leucospilota]|uniref:Uncharacterized protein n=1 Tax=Holothuria leucospilota TaxID=206669 RepID=A0A9Q1HHW3_HOLLE|nr:hypothetical protein HOLleu_08552 [Holothuria leucospilota]